MGRVPPLAPDLTPLVVRFHGEPVEPLVCVSDLVDAPLGFHFALSLDNDGDQVVVLHSIDGQIVARLVVEHDNIRPAFLSCLVVHPDHRRRHLASALLRVVIVAADARCVQLGLRVNPFGGGGLDRAALEAWYRRLGFAPVFGGVDRDGFPWSRLPRAAAMAGRRA